MVLNTLQPVEGGSGSKFYDILDDEVRMSAIFERFVRNFFRSEQHTYPQVEAEGIRWNTDSLDQLHSSFLPNMRTDVTLRSDDEVIIIDAKFYKEPFKALYGGHPKVNSGNLYQLLTYLTHSAYADIDQRPIRGILLYPSVDGQQISLHYRLGGHVINIRTIDFSRDWKSIHEQMLGLLHLVPKQNGFDCNNNQLK
jgi:5-methylcytosine-specific restriction enzyme subunit McrC